MSKRKTIQLLAAVMLLSSAVACNLFSGDQGVSDGKNSAEEVVSHSNKKPLPSLKAETISIEGQKSNISLKLYDKPSLPFITYVPKNYFVDEVEVSDEETVVSFYVQPTGGNAERQAYIRVFILAEATTVKGMQERVTSKGGLVQKNQWQLINQTKEVPYSWAKERISFRKSLGNQFINGSVFIGEHNGKAFTVVEHFPVEYGDGFAPISGKILSNLQFR